MKVQVIFGGIVLAALLGTGTVSAQNVGGGVKIGANFATVGGDPGCGSSCTKSVRTGGIGGGFLIARITDMIAFQPEVLYSQEGVKLQGTDRGQAFEATAKIGTVQIPLLLRVAPKMTSGGASGYFIVGPAIGVIASAKQEQGGQTEDFKDDLKSWDASIVFGGGVTISHFLVEARYAAGMTDLNKTPESTGKVRSNVFSILVGGSW